MRLPEVCIERPALTTVMSLAIVLIGFALGPLIWAVTAAWVLYRVIRGILYFKDQRPIPGV